MTTNPETSAPRLSIASTALIRSRREGRTIWLAQWNLNWRAYHFVGGRKRPEESFRDCIVREIGEELDLTAPLEFRIRSGAPKRLEFEAFSESARIETHYIIELFDIELANEDVCSKVNADPRNRWLTEVEIARGLTEDGQRVSPTMARVRAAARI